MIVLGLHGGTKLNQHEPATALCVNGKIVALCEEERYLRIKSCYGMLPLYSIQACLRIQGIVWEDIDLVTVPGITYSDNLDWWRSYLTHHFGSCPKIERVHHQEAHLATAFYGSGLESSLVLSLDASGDGACGMIASASKTDGIKVLETIPTENSLGFFYTLMTYFMGFQDGDEYKVMGLAPYGKPTFDLSAIVAPSDQGWHFNQEFVRSNPAPSSPFEPAYSDKVEALLGFGNRTVNDKIDDRWSDLARSVQHTFEDCLLSFVNHAKTLAGEYQNLCYAGGIALNCSANQRLLSDPDFEQIYVSPIASDRGLAAGCAYLGAVELGDRPLPMWDAYLGQSYANDAIASELGANGVAFEEVDDPSIAAAELIDQGKIIGWHQGRSEAGARALGARSILAKCDTEEMRDLVNQRIKYREKFRPFAPSVLQEDMADWFDTNGRDDFPYMTFTLDVPDHKREALAAITHVDGTARVQSVRSTSNELYYELIRHYKSLSDRPVILNTSFNLKGQPIVETPRDALMTFFGCGLDALVVGNFVINKSA